MGLVSGTIKLLSSVIWKYFLIQFRSLSPNAACTFSTFLPLSVHCSRFRCCGGWLMVNLRGSAVAQSEGRRRPSWRKRGHFTAIIHPCFVPAALPSVCIGMECRGRRDAEMEGWMGQGVEREREGEKRGAEGGRLGVWEVKKSRG